VLHEALTARADPLHLALVFGLSHTTASKYTLIACDSSPARRPTLTRNSAMLAFLCSAGGGAVQAGGIGAAACYGRTLKA
jgi:hypothetical protein